jgi:hypothetical protein
MNAVHQTDGTTDSLPVPQSADGQTDTRPITGHPLGENDRRATEVGPILEEILRTHWEHWGLND